MWTATPRIGVARFLFSTAPHHPLEFLTAKKKRPKRSVSGFRIVRKKALRHTNLEYLSDQQRNWTERVQPSRTPGFHSRFSTRTLRPPAATSQSAPCILLKAWSSALW